VRLEKVIEMHFVKSAAVVATIMALGSPAIASATKEDHGNRAHCDLHSIGKKIPVVGRVTTGEKLHCSLYVTEETKEAILNGGGVAAAATACTALSAAIIAAGGGPEDPVADALATASEGVCTASVSTAVIVMGESCKGGVDLIADGKAQIAPPKGHVSIKGQACR
jgi:hypothetical protein